MKRNPLEKYMPLNEFLKGATTTFEKKFKSWKIFWEVRGGAFDPSRPPLTPRLTCQTNGLTRIKHGSPNCKPYLKLTCFKMSDLDPFFFLFCTNLGVETKSIYVRCHDFLYEILVVVICY
jgi:hypothetical protein